MNKASVSKKALSVFLSVLMVLSCCVTAFPWLADTFGLKLTAEAASSQAQWNAVKDAVTTALSKAGNANSLTYTKSEVTNSRTLTDTSARGVVFPIVYALATCIKNDVVTGSSSTANGARPGTLLSLTNTKIDDMTWSDISTYNSTIKTKLKDIAQFLIYYSGANNNGSGDFYYHAGNKKEESHQFVTWIGTTPSDYAGLGEPDDITITVKRSAKAAVWYNDALSDVGANVETSFTLKFDNGRDKSTRDDTNWLGTGKKYSYGWYYYVSSTVSSKSTSASNISYVNSFFTYFKASVSYTSGGTTTTCERVQADPFGQFTNLTAASAAVTAVTNAYNALWNSGYWSKDDTTDVNIINHFSNQYTLVAGDSVSDTAFTNAVDTYKAAVEDTERYYMAKPYAQTLYQYTTNTASSTYCDRDSLWFVDADDYIFTNDGCDSMNRKVLTYWYTDYTQEGHPSVRRTEVKAHDNYAYKSRLTIQGYLQAVKTAYTALETIYGNYHSTKGYAKLSAVDSYYQDDVEDLIALLKAYDDYQTVQDDKVVADNYIANYDIPTVDGVNVLAPLQHFHYRDNDPTAENYVPDMQIETMYGTMMGLFNTYTYDDTYSTRVKFYVFGNLNHDQSPDIQYLQAAAQYLGYEASRRSCVMELAPFIEYFTPLTRMDLSTVTVTQLQSHILTDQKMFEDVFDYLFTDGEGHALLDTQGNEITTASLGYNDTTNKFCYINVYKKYYNRANSGEFNDHPLARADLLNILGDFNEDVQTYIENLYRQLALVMRDRILEAMNATSDANNNITITLSNFSVIKTTLERVTRFYTTLTDPTYDANEVQNGVAMFDYLKNSCWMYKQSHKDATHHFDDDYVNTRLSLINMSITTELGNTYTLQQAYDLLMACTLLAKVETFISQGGLANWQQLHYYDETDGNPTQGYKFSKPEAYMIRLPYAADLGRGNDTVANDTYTVTNKMVEDLVTQLDTFLGSNDMVAILSSFIKDDASSSILTDLKLSEYVMKLLGEKLFTDEIINKLVGMLFPLVTSMLEDLWNDLDGQGLVDIGDEPLRLYTYSDGKTIYQLAEALGLYIYPDLLVNHGCLNGDQLANVRNAINGMGSSLYAGSGNKGQNRSVGWTNLIAAYHTEEDENTLNLNWGINSVQIGTDESYQAWFTRRANAFKFALSGVLSGVEGLLKTIMSGYRFGPTAEIREAAHVYRPGTWWPPIVKLDAYAGLADITIEGINGYSRIIVPLLEALGCNDNYIYRSDQVYSNLNNTSKIVNAILDPIVHLVTDDVASAPIGTILTLLPNLLYFLSFNTLDQLLADLKIVISNGKLNIDASGIATILEWIEPRVANILEIDAIENKLPEGITVDSDGITDSDSTITIELFKLLGKNSVNDLITAVDISDINAIIALILQSVLGEQGDLEIPIVDVGSVLARTQLYETTNTAPSGQPARPYIGTKAIKSDGSTYNRRYFEADKADMFYDIVSWVARAFQNDSFISQLVAIITKSNASQDALVEELLLGVKLAGPAHFVMGLVEVFQPKARAGAAASSVWYQTTYKPADYTWYGRDNAQNNMENKTISKFLYVAYQNNWTYVKANTFVENADTIITKLLENQLRERDVNSFGEWLLSLINLAWSNVAISTVMDLLVALGNLTKNELITYIVGRFTEAGMDLSEWYKAFGYLFPATVEEEVDSGEVDENNNPIMIKQVPAELDPSNAAYTNVFGKLSVEVNTNYQPSPGSDPGTSNDANRYQKYIWSYDADGDGPGEPKALVDGDRQTFQEILSYMLTGGSGTKGGMMPAIDIFLSGKKGVLFPQENNTSLLTIRGSNGYDSALVPFFEALGMNELLTAEDFKGFAESVGLDASNDFATGSHMLRQSEFNKIASEQLKVEYLFNVAFGFLEKLMTPEYTEKLDDQGHVVLDENNQPVMVPVYNELVKKILTTVLPSSLYFLQSNGLSVMIRNLLQPVLTLVDAILPMFNFNIDGTGTPLDDLLDELIGRFVLPLLHKEGDRQIATDGEGHYLYETDKLGNPKTDADGNVIYIYDDDYGVSLKDLSLHRIASLVEKLLGINMEPFVYGLDAICSSVTARDQFADSASETSTDAFWSTTGARNSFRKPIFLNGSYYQVVAGVNGAPPTTTGVAQDVNDPANVLTILLSLVLDLVLVEKSKSPVRTPVLDENEQPVYIVDQNGNKTTMIQYTYTVVDGEQQYYTNADAIVNVIKAFTSSEIVDMIPAVITAIRELGFTAAWTITPNWSYFDDLDRGPDDRRTTEQLILEAEASANGLINTPVRTIYYLRYAENFTGSTNLWSRELATYLDTSLSDLADWIIGEFVAKDGSTLGQYLTNLLSGEGGLIKKGLINTINAALRDGIGGAVAQFAELLNIFISFDVNFWNNDPYPEEEEDDPLSLTEFGAALARLFTPLNEVLTWLLSGTDIAMFHSYQTTGGYTEWVMNASERPAGYGDIKDLIKLPGGQGYWVALVPLLEMLGIELPTVGEGEAKTYKYLRESEGANAGRIYYYNNGEKVYASGLEILTDVIVSVVSQVEGWLRGEDPLGLGDNVIDCVLNRLANVIYFLNANGLVTVVINLLSPLLPLANAIVPLIFNDLQVPTQGEDEEPEAYETRKFIALVDALLDELLYTVPLDENNQPVLDEHGNEVHTPLLPQSFSIVDLNLYNIFEVIKDITKLDINGAVNADFYVNGENGDDGTVYTYNYLKSFFLGDISMRTSANGDKYFRMDFNDEESRADFITIIIYTLMDVVNDAVKPGTNNNEFFVNILGKTKDANNQEIVDTALGQQKLTDLYNMIHSKVSGYEGYDWFYFDKEAREAYYARTPDTEYSPTLVLKLEAILQALAADGYQVDWNDTTMKYLLTGYLNYTDTNLWDMNTARAVEARFGEIVKLAMGAITGDDAATVGSYVTGLLEDVELYSNRYIVMLGAMLGDLLKGIPENVTNLLAAAVPGFDATYWNQYVGKAVEDNEHPAGTVERDPDTNEITKEYIALELYTNKTEFVNKFVALFEPFGYLLDWLLVGENKGLELFYVVDDAGDDHYGVNDRAAISIGGANGFKEGLVPLLEALGLKFTASEVNDPDLTGIECVRITLNSLLNWVDDLLTAEDGEGNNNTIGALVDLLPNIIYFINANGLTVTVLNTLRSLTNILELASGLISTGGNDITNLNTLLGLASKGIDLYDLSFEGICRMVKGLTGLDILSAVSLPLLDDENNVVLDENNNIVYQDSYLKQWAIGKVTTNTGSALYPERSTYRMDFTYTPEQIAAFGTNWPSDLSVEERARRMERINIFTVLICSVIDVFKFEGNGDTLRGWLGDSTYDMINDILNLTATQIHYDPFDWFYFSDEITGSSLDATSGNWATYFPADGSEYVVKYLDTTPYSLIYKYGYFDYYRHEAGETGNLWNKDSVGYLKTNFYGLIDTVIDMATDYDSAAAFIADAWNGVNLYSKKNLYTVGYTIGNLLGGFEGVLDLALGILLGTSVQDDLWDEYMLHRVTEKEELVGTDVMDENNNVVKYKNQNVTYIADGSMDRTVFINKLVDIFSPADFLISWFLVGGDTPLEFMYDKYGGAAISVNGGNGYDEALVPILEAFGCDLTDSVAYFAANGGKTGLNVVKYVADKLLGRIDGIAGSANPVEQIVAMLPELIYFINANGLSVCVSNLLQPVISLLGLVNNFVDTGDIGEITTIDQLFAFAMNMLGDSLGLSAEQAAALDISDLSITGIFNVLKAFIGVDINGAMTFPQVTINNNGEVVPVEPTKEINIYKQLALGKVTRYTSANGRTAFRMDACDDEAALSQIDMIAVLMATAVNVFLIKDADENYVNKDAFVKLFGENGEAIFDAIVNILNMEEGKYFDYDWLYTLRYSDTHKPYLDPEYEGRYISPIDGMSMITGTAGYDRYWTKEMAQYVADNLVKVVNNVLLLIGISIPGIDGPIESIDDLINGLIPGGSLYTNELLAKITTLVAGTGEVDDNGVEDIGLKAKLVEIDPDGLIQGLLRDLLGINLDLVWAYKGRTEFGFTDGDRDGFVRALAEFLRPVKPLLEWLLTDKSISLFYNYDASDLIKLPGGNGYEQAVIPLFEAVIGYDNPYIKTLAEYKHDISVDPDYLLIDILNPLLDFVDAALADPLNVILSRIPAIVYFINSKAADRMVKNLLSPVYQLLNALNTLVDVDLDSIVEGAIGYTLEELDFNAIIEVVIGLLPDNLSSLSPLIVDAVREFTIGKVIQYPSHATFQTDLGYPYTYGFTMVLDESTGTGSGGVTYGSTNATLADLITILLRALIKWLTMPENQETVVTFLSENIENEQVRTYVLNAYGVDADTLGAIDTGLIGFRYQPYGVSQMMAVLYYVYFAVNVASSEAIEAVGKYGNYWPYVAKVLTNQTLNGVVDLSFMSGFITYLNGLVERVNGQNGNGGDNGNGSGYTPTTEDNDSGSGKPIGEVIEDIGNTDPSTSHNLNFFQKLIKWFQDLFARIGSLFGR